MNRKIYDDGDVQIYERNYRYFIRYDVGTHQITIREDEITADEATLANQDPSAITKILFDLQRRLEAAGINPYVTNL